MHSNQLPRFGGFAGLKGYEGVCCPKKNALIVKNNLLSLGLMIDSDGVAPTGSEGNS